MHNNKIFRA